MIRTMTMSVLRRLVVLVVALSFVAMDSSFRGLALAADGTATRNLRGDVVDAARHPLVGARVELLRAVAGRPVGSPVLVTSTDSEGGWSFTSVPAREYIVRVVVNGRTVGLAVSVGASSLDGLVIVAPSVAAPGAESIDNEDDRSCDRRDEEESQRDDSNDETSRDKCGAALWVALGLVGVGAGLVAPLLLDDGS